MRYTVLYVGWSKGEPLGMDTSDTAPHVPPLKTTVVLDGRHYLVGAIESELRASANPLDAMARTGTTGEWKITVRLAKTQ